MYYVYWELKIQHGSLKNDHWVKKCWDIAKCISELKWIKNMWPSPMKSVWSGSYWSALGTKWRSLWVIPWWWCIVQSLNLKLSRLYFSLEMAFSCLKLGLNVPTMEKMMLMLCKMTVLPNKTFWPQWNPIVLYTVVWFITMNKFWKFG